MQAKKPKGEIETEALLRFHAAEKFTVVALTPKGAFKLFKVVFSKKDGSVMLPFSHHGEKRGRLSEIDPAVEPDPKALSLTRNGITVDYDVKCSFHTSGWVVFSKTGEDDLLPRRLGFPLKDSMGHLFEFRAYDLAGFEPIDLSIPTHDYYVRLRFPVRPRSIMVTGTWHTKKDMVANAERDPLGRPIGPDDVQRVRRKDGLTERATLLGQPRGYPLRDHLLLLTMAVIPDADGADTPTMIFLGGWDAHEGKAPASLKRLAFMYPFMRGETESKS